MEMLRTEATVVKYVIIAPRDGRLKYVGIRYNPKADYGYSVKINGAMMFDKPEAAIRAMERFGIKGTVGKIQKHFELLEVDCI